MADKSPSPAQAGEATLEIPPEYVGWMRFAAVKELEMEGESLHDQASDARKALVERGLRMRHSELGEPDAFDHLMSDLNGTRRHLSEALEVTADLCEAETPGTVHGCPEALVWLLDSVCRHVIAPEISESYGALEGEGLQNHLAPMIAALQWAGDEAGRLRAVVDAERQEAGGGRREKG